MSVDTDHCQLCGAVPRVYYHRAENADWDGELHCNWIHCPGCELNANPCFDEDDEKSMDEAWRDWLFLCEGIYRMKKGGKP